MLVSAAAASVKTPIQIAASFTSRFSPLSFSKSPFSSSICTVNNIIYNINKAQFATTSLSVSIPFRQSRCFSAMATTDEATMDAVQRKLMFDDE